MMFRWLDRGDVNDVATLRGLLDQFEINNRR